MAARQAFSHRSGNDGYLVKKIEMRIQMCPTLPTRVSELGKHRKQEIVEQMLAEQIFSGHSTVTLLAKLRGWSTSVPLTTAV